MRKLGYENYRLNVDGIVYFDRALPFPIFDCVGLFPIPEQIFDVLTPHDFFAPNNLINNKIHLF